MLARIKWWMKIGWTMGRGHETRIIPIGLYASKVESDYEFVNIKTGEKRIAKNYIVYTRARYSDDPIWMG